MKSKTAKYELLVFISVIIAVITVIVAIAEEGAANDLKSEISVDDQPLKQEEMLFSSIEETLPDNKYECVRNLPNGEQIEFHHYNDRIYRESTCEETGFDDYYCDACKSQIHIDYPLKDHLVINGFCRFCNKELTAIIEAGEGYIIQEEDVLETTDLSSEDIGTEQTEEKESTMQDTFNLICAYENFIRMPSEYMRTKYLSSLSEENKQALLNYITEQSELNAEREPGNE